MDKSKLPYIVGLVILSIILIIVLWIIAIIGAMDLTDGCLYRYNFNKDHSVSNADSITNTITLKANANYKVISSGGKDANLRPDPSGYGKWLNTNLRLGKEQKVKFVIKGEVSLCKAYLPKYNLQNESNLDTAGHLIEIPRVEDKLSTPVTLTFDAKTPQWRNITQLFKNDKISVVLYKDQKSSFPIHDSITKNSVTPDCHENQRTYEPKCGRYSIWYSATYVTRCEAYKESCNCRRVCKGWNAWGWCIKGHKTVCDQCTAYRNVDGTAPEPYKNNGTYTSPWSNDIGTLIRKFYWDCRTEHTQVAGDYQHEKYFWYSADNAAALLYRFDGNENPTNKSARGGTYSLAKIQQDQGDIPKNANYRSIFKQTFLDENISYLQYRFLDTGNFASNTGGYVLGIKQTKCRRENGNAFNDTFNGRGVVQYVIADYGHNPNDTSNITPSAIMVDKNGSGSLTTAGNQEGYLWLRINNKDEDYKDSFGQYQVQFLTQNKTADFYSVILDPFLKSFKGRIKDAATTIFKNMTCYKGIGGDGGCTNFFTYIKVMLIIYIMFYGMMFLLGMVKINQTDLVIRVVKIAFVAGLMNDKTFEFFNNYIFDSVTGFTDQIIANMSGYSLFSGSTTITNPLMFMNEVMTRVLISSTFAAQMMAMLSMGLNGVLYFIIIFVCIGILLLVLFRSMAVYLMAYMAIAVLLGIAPLFLTFVLFERTRYLFDNWVKFTFRYMIEPVILLAGIIILTQLMTIYLDYVVGYSVCWKCAIPIKVPFSTIPGITPAFLDVDLFCFNWFAPWGFDARSTQMGLSMQNIAVLLILAYCLWGYIEFSGTIVARIGGVGGPSATMMGAEMSNAAENHLLKKVGLDQKSRGRIKQAATKRLESMERGSKKAPLQVGNRKDVESVGNTNNEPNAGETMSNINAGPSSGTAMNRNKPWIKPVSNLSPQAEINSNNEGQENNQDNPRTVRPNINQPNSSGQAGSQDGNEEE
ncbi:MAG: type IV secretion system protein [Rickettsiaceae bacterium]